jgi:hypothetical protein
MPNMPLGFDNTNKKVLVTWKANITLNDGNIEAVIHQH